MGGTPSALGTGAEALARGHVVGVEALARWPHIERGEIAPAQFIPVAERTGRIVTAAAVITPTTDAYTLALLAGPLMVLYEVSIVLVRCFGKAEEA